jgi:hypothetical protein
MGAVRIALTAVTLLLSCAPAATPKRGTHGGGDGATYGPSGVEPPPLAVDLSGWREWPKSNPRRFRSKGHGYMWVDVHVRPEHARAYADRVVPAAPGFIIAMAGYDTTDGQRPTGITVMAKMPPGYDPAHGDWYFAVFDPEGESATLGGKLAPCAGCHVDARDRDFLFGVAPKDKP